MNTMQQNSPIKYYFAVSAPTPKSCEKNPQKHCIIARYKENTS